MHIQTLRIKNFRRLTDVRIDLESDISIFVGANNSGKTSTSQALELFTKASRDRFSIHDFSAACWKEIDAFGDQVQRDIALPKISIDIWFNVEANDIHRIIDLLPSLNWEGAPVGLRIEFAASDEVLLQTRFLEARAKAQANIQPGHNGDAEYHPWPRTLCEYLTENLRREFELRYYVLNHANFDASFVENENYTPFQITADKGRGGKEILNSLLRVDFLNAQRHLSDSVDGSRSEDLSRCLSRFYERNLEKRGDDYTAMHALADSEAMLNDHLTNVFEPTLNRLAKMNYPGLSNPRLLIKTALNPAALMSSHDGTKVHYALGDPQNSDTPTLPDRYNGLGYKNLIYMVVELLDLHTQWIDIEENRPLVHLVFIEEPEAHLHAQLQQVFIRQVLDILSLEKSEASYYQNQLVVTTHSPHILFERGFRPIRYFRRTSSTAQQTSEVLNLSAFYEKTAEPTRDFLERYLKLMHCDLFFADAAVLVEGNVERLLLPQMIEIATPDLKSAYLSILEIGGAFGYRFRSLIEFLGITALIITDIDSVRGTSGGNDNNEDIVDEDDDDTEEKVSPSTSCQVLDENAVTSNQTLIQWLLGMTTISALLAATPDQRTQYKTNDSASNIRVAYQTEVNTTWGENTKLMIGRTLEEAFALENLEWCQDKLRSDLKLRILKNEKLTLDQLAEQLYKKIKSSGFKKTDFALALLAQDPTTWVVPSYIRGGLQWLQNEVRPPLSKLSGTSMSNEVDL